jgi:type VI protein secretion system component Hcp
MINFSYTFCTKVSRFKLTMKKAIQLGKKIEFKETKLTNFVCSLRSSQSSTIKDHYPLQKFSFDEFEI